MIRSKNVYSLNNYINWKVFGFFVFALLMMVFPFEILAQTTSDTGLQEVDTALASEVTIFKTIMKRILEVILAVGIIGVVWAYSSKDQNAKQYLTYFVIAIVVAGVGRALFLA